MSRGGIRKAGLQPDKSSTPLSRSKYIIMDHVKEMDENTARQYIKGLLLVNKPQLRQKALERFKERFGHPFWETKNNSGQKGTIDLIEYAREIGLIEKE